MVLVLRYSIVGTTYIFNKNGGTWSQAQELNAPNPASFPPNTTYSAAFGQAISLSGDGSTALIGGDGKGYIFTKSASGWNESQELNGSGNDLNAIGNAVSLSRDNSTALVGGLNEAYIFTNNNGSWVQAQRLAVTDVFSTDNERFGNAVSLSSDGSIALIGAYNTFIDGSSGIGAAYIFTKNNGTWSQTQELTTPDISYNQQFGYAVSISADGSTALIGAYQKVVNGVYAGAAYIFTQPLITTTATSLSLNSAPNPSVYGQPDTFTANLTPATATGSVTFAIGNNAIVTSTVTNGTATYVTNSLPVGTNVITATFTSSDPNYTNASTTTSITVNPATPTVSVIGSTFTYDGQAHPASVSVTGINGATVNGTVVVSYNPGGSSVPINTGTYGVTVSFTSSDANYTNGSGTGSITINKANQTIAFAALPDQFIGASNFQLTATASSGLSVSYSSTNSAVCSVSGNSVTILGVGSCTILAAQVGNNNYNAASSVSQSFAVKYNICLLYDPLKQATSPSHTLKIKLQLCNASGKNISTSTLTLTAINVDGNAALLQASSSANPGYLFTYSSSGYYQFNLKVPTSGLNPGNQHYLTFTVGGDTTNSYTAPFYTK